MKYHNALPLAPKQAIDFQTAHGTQKLASDETIPTGLTEQLGINDAMKSLEADQPENFISFNLKQTGYDVQVREIDWETIDFENVQQMRKAIQLNEVEQVQAMAKAFLCPEEMLTETEIRKLDWQQLQPAPIVKLAHERANALLCAAGWDGNIERYVDVSNEIPQESHTAFQEAGVTDEMWEAALKALDANLSIDKINNWSKGYLTTHYQSIAFEIFESSREYEIHHRSDAIFVGSLIKPLLEELPRTPKAQESAQTHNGYGVAHQHRLAR